MATNNCTNTNMKVTSGAITLPSQPAVLALRNADVSNATGDGTVYTLVTDSTVFDQGSNYSSNTTFTAPTTGIYLFTAFLVPSGLSASFTLGKIRIVTTARTFEFLFDPAKIFFVNETSCSITCIGKMSAADTATCTLTISGSTKTVGIAGNTGTGGPIVDWFSATLIS